MITSITTTEAQQLSAMERVIESGLQTFAEVGNALLAIRDARLYRATHGTFEAYCRERWGFARRTAYQYIEAAQVVENVRHGAQTEPATERQARPLAKLEPDEQPKAWQAATEKAESEGRRVTASDVEEAVEKRKEEQKRQPIMSKKQAAAMKPRVGLKYARLAIGNLEQIKDNDEERAEGFALVKGWITDNEA